MRKPEWEDGDVFMCVIDNWSRGIQSVRLECCEQDAVAWKREQENKSSDGIARVFQIRAKELFI